MKIIRQALIIALLSFVAGTIFNLLTEKGVNPFGAFSAGIDLSHDQRTLKDIKDVISMFENGTAVFIDVRDRDEYRAGHIPKALNAPYFYMERAYAVIADKLILGNSLILYGRDVNDIAPLRTADYYEQRLFTADHSKNVRILYGGIDTWTKAGLPVDKGSKNE